MLSTRRVIPLVLAAMLSTVLFAGPDRNDRITLRKQYHGGVEQTVEPNKYLAVWSITVGGATTEKSLLYLGKKGDNTVEIQSREIERSTKTDKVKEIANEKISVSLDCDGETICQLDLLKVAVQLVDNTLHYRIISDWDTEYIVLKKGNQTCKNGHKWAEKDNQCCPVCGAGLKFADGQ